MESDRPAIRAWLVHPEIRGVNDARDADAALDEASSLALALPGIALQGAGTVRLPRAFAGHLFGSGKVAELKALFEEHEIGLVLIDGPVTPIQQRNLEREWKVKVLDRTGLILEIFADRARTREGVLQVEMAQLSYQRSRLVRAWSHLERQRGATGTVGGPGETQRESDRRAIDEQLVRLRRQLEKVARTRDVNRAARAAVPFPVVALAGYTNAGKSTLFNRLTGAGVMAKEMLFATLDPTMRRLHLPSGQEVILSDTVGFISDLPHELVAAFRATLEEVLEADVILHVRDMSHPESARQAQEVEAILHELGVGDDVARIEVWNKIDRLDAAEHDALLEQARRRPDTVAISAASGEGIDTLLAAIAARTGMARRTARITLGHDDGRRRAWLFARRLVRDEEETPEGSRLTVEWTERQQAEFDRL
ncbi:MAG: GTPase HflX [Rubellimicrobium sp.]|nr:GTPase HflX [Rubellimicrobium sp.]